MQRNIVRLGHPGLRLQAEPVAPESLATEEMQALIAELIETVRSRSGRGLAATQVGESHQILVMVTPGDGDEPNGSEIVSRPERPAVTTDSRSPPVFATLRS